MIKSIKTLALGLAAVAFATGSASALTIVQSGTYVGVTAGTSTVPLTFNKFDTNLGTLNSIRFQITLTSTGGALRIDNDGPAAASGTFQFGGSALVSSVDVDLRGPGAGPGDNFNGQGASATGGAAFSLDPDDLDGGGFQSGGTDFAEYIGGTVVDTSFDRFINAGFFAGYVQAGGGTYNINLNSDQIAEYGGLGNVEAQISPIGLESVITITYDYSELNEVPEPGTIAMSALLLLGVGGFYYNRRKTPGTTDNDPIA